MAGAPSRHKSLVLLAGVIILQVVLLAVQIKRDSQGRLLRVWTVGAVSPFERAGAKGIGNIRGTWSHYFALQNTSRDNEQLRRENDALKLQVNQLQSKAAEADRLAALLNFRQGQLSVPMLAARVIGTSADTASQTVYLDRGERDGIRRNMGVITPDGVVGKVIESYRDTAQVLLLTDKESGVGAMLADSRIQSPVGGTGEPLLSMKYIPTDDAVSMGEHVVTSGMDRIFPRDLPVGIVIEIKTGRPFQQVRLRESMINDAFDLRLAETHIEVHKFRSGAIVAAVILSLMLQAFVPVYIPKFATLDLPLLVTIYFGLSRRNPSTGLLLGMVIGLLQDSLSGPTVPLGLYGIAKTIIGYLASSIGARLDTEHPAARFALTMSFFVVHQGFITLTRRLLLAEPEPWFTLRLAIAAAVNAVVAVVLFVLMDRLRKS